MLRIQLIFKENSWAIFYFSTEEERNGDHKKISQTEYWAHVTTIPLLS